MDVDDSVKVQEGTAGKMSGARTRIVTIREAFCEGAQAAEGPAVLLRCDEEIMPERLEDREVTTRLCEFRSAELLLKLWSDLVHPERRLCQV